MKDNIRMGIMMAALATLPSCNKDTNEEETVFPERGAIVLTRAQSEVLTQANAFAFNLFRDIEQAVPGEDVFISPLSLQAVLSMLANGAKGETRSQIVEAMGYGGFSIEEVNSTFKAISDGLKTVDSSIDLKMANAVWLRQDFTPLADFTSAMADWYDATVQGLDFSSSSAVQAINDWCSAHTGGMIDKMIDHLAPRTVAILMNALYFKGQWAQKFDKAATAQGDFTRSDGTKASLWLMHKEEKMSACRDEGWQFCRMPFGNGAYRLSILLPEEGFDFEAFVSGLDAEFWQTALEACATASVQLTVPRLSLDFSIEDELRMVLEKEGITSVFSSEEADLSGISTDYLSLWVDSIIQKAKFEMDEDGAKAAAVTAAIVNGITSPGPIDSMVMTADHPFVFVIDEASTGAILFMGAFRGL